MSERKNIFIIDGNSFIHRAFHALPPLTNSEGFPTNSITGTLNMINAIMNKFEYEKIIICFDSKEKTFRHEMYQEYKANRPPTDPDLKKQFQPIRDIIKALGLPILIKDGVEADDTMVSLAIKAEKEGYNAIIATSDKDIKQCVNEHIFILDTKDADTKGEYYGVEGVIEREGVTPEQIIDKLSLMGDKADNIPGIQGVGNKTAIKLIQDFGTIENLINNTEELKGKLKEKIENGIDDLKLSKELVIIKKDVDVPSIKDLVGEKNPEELIKLLDTYQLDRLKKSFINDSDLKSLNFDLPKEIYNYKHLDFDVIKSIRSDQSIIMKTFSFNNKDFFLINYLDETYLTDTDDEMFFALIDKIYILNPQLVSNNIKSVLKRIYNNYKPTNYHINVYDLENYAYIFNSYNLKTNFIDFVNDKITHFNLCKEREEFKLFDPKKSKYDKMDYEQLLKVSLEEIFILNQFLKDIRKDKTYTNSELIRENAISSILAKMEHIGSKIDVNKLTNYESVLNKEIDNLKNKIFEMAGEEFNINSPKQVGEILFDKIGIETKKRSTAEDILISLADKNPIINHILNYRSLSKIVSTYITGLIKRADDKDRLHTTYTQTLTATGRLSSVDPNLQNIPIRTKEGSYIRECFIAKEGYKIVALDYSQIELRLLAIMANVKHMVDAFKNNKDIHRATAATILDINYDDVSDEQRRIAKGINFGLIYGMGAKKLAKELNIEKKEAESYLNAYFEKYSEVKPYFEKQLDKARKDLYVETLFGRKIPTTDIQSTNAFVRTHAERAANNASIQGTAADIIKLAMIRISNEILDSSNNDINMLMQVHDELVFEIKDDKVQEYSIKIKNVMESVIKNEVPLLVEYNIADNWLEAH
tara:strand:+ start:63541 stop:66159 length:2619 start_codon:yes stop_codon:yes gene_type:complete